MRGIYGVGSDEIAIGELGGGIAVGSEGADPCVEFGSSVCRNRHSYEYDVVPTFLEIFGFRKIYFFMHAVELSVVVEIGVNCNTCFFGIILIGRLDVEKDIIIAHKAIEFIVGIIVPLFPRKREHIRITVDIYIRKYRTFIRISRTDMEFWSRTGHRRPLESHIQRTGILRADRGVVAPDRELERLAGRRG